MEPARGAAYGSGDGPFSPKWHNAVEHVTDSRVPENTVVGEYRRGYVKDGRVLRYSDVVVAN